MTASAPTPPATYRLPRQAGPWTCIIGVAAYVAVSPLILRAPLDAPLWIVLWLAVGAIAVGVVAVGAVRASRASREHLDELHRLDTECHDLAELADTRQLALESLVEQQLPAFANGTAPPPLPDVEADELGYSPHAMARSLASRTSHVVGVMVSDLHNPFWAEVVDGLDAAARAAGFELVINSGGRSPSLERQALRGLLSFRPAGIALLGPVVAAPEIAAAAGQTPLVLVSRSSRLSTVDTVNDNGKVGSGLAVDHLVSLGHKEIVHIDGGGGSQAAPRRTGYRAAMLRHGLTPRVVRGEYTEAAGEAAVRSLVASGRDFTAVLAANDLNAVGVISALEAAGLAVPGDVSVVGYDNTWLAALRTISLTTIDQPRVEMGRLAAESLVSRVRGERTTPVRHLLPPRLVERATTAEPAN